MSFRGRLRGFAAEFLAGLYWAWFGECVEDEIVVALHKEIAEADKWIRKREAEIHDLQERIERNHDLATLDRKQLREKHAAELQAVMEKHARELHVCREKMYAADQQWERYARQHYGLPQPQPQIDYLQQLMKAQFENQKPA
jgi:hypothetical protein